MKGAIRSFSIVIGFLAFAALPALARDANVPNTFTAGTTAVAGQVNANFTELEGAVNTKQDRVTGTCAAGSSIRIINANGTVTCEPDDSAPGGGTNSGVDWTVVERTNINVASATNLASVALTAPASGYVVVRFDGFCYATGGSRILLAASNQSLYTGVNSSHTQVIGDPDAASQSFSHSRAYQVSSGSRTYYAVADHVSGGSSVISVYGTLTVQYFPSRY